MCVNLICDLFFDSPEHPPCHAARAAVRRPFRAPVPGERSAAAHQAAARHRSPALVPAQTAVAAKPEAAPAERSCPSGLRRRLAAVWPPMRPAGSGAGSSGSTGRWRGSTGPGSGSERVAGTAAESTEAGSPTRAHETAAARWSRARHATRNPAGTGASCGSRHRHAGPWRGCRKDQKNSSSLQNNHILTKWSHTEASDHDAFIGVYCPWWCSQSSLTRIESPEQKAYKSLEEKKYYGLI